MNVDTTIRKFDDLVRCTNVMADGLKVELNKFVSQQENCHMKWRTVEEENQETKKYMAKFKTDQGLLEIKLRKTRKQLDMEIENRVKAEQSVDHMKRQLELIKELLRDRDGGNSSTAADKQALVHSTILHHPDVTESSSRAEELGFTLSQSFNTVGESTFVPESDYDNLSENDLMLRTPR